MNYSSLREFHFRLLFVLGFALTGFQRQGIAQSTADGFLVTGKVNNNQGEKVVGAAILVKGTTIGTATDTSGFFSLKVPSKESILVISHFSTSKSTELSLNGSAKVVVRLGENENELAEKEFLKYDYSILEKVEESPKPSIGELEWNKYLAKNVKYHENDRLSGLEGTVIVGFEVHEDGAIHNIRILKGIGGESDQEVARLLAEGPKWLPGKINGEVVKTQMSLPVLFVISDTDKITSTKDLMERSIANQYGKHLVVMGYY